MSSVTRCICARDTMVANCPVHGDAIGRGVMPQRNGCSYCGFLDWTVEKYGRVTHKEGCPMRRDPWHQGDPNPADPTWPPQQLDLLIMDGHALAQCLYEEGLDDRGEMVEALTVKIEDMRALIRRMAI